jgi:hypothetical protein
MDDKRIAHAPLECVVGDFTTTFIPCAQIRTTSNRRQFSAFSTSIPTAVHSGHKLDTAFGVNPPVFFWHTCR